MVIRAVEMTVWRFQGKARGVSHSDQAVNSPAETASDTLEATAW